MNTILVDLIGGILLNIYCIYFCYNLLDKKFNALELKNVIILLAMTIIGILLNYFCPQTIKFILTFLVIMTVIFFIADKSIQKACLLFIILEINIAICEMVDSFVIYRYANGSNMLIINMISNYFVTILGLILLKIKLPNKIYKIILNSVTSIKKNEIILYSIIVIFILIISTIESYMKLPIHIVIVINTIMALIFIFIIIKFVYTKNSYELISDKYQTSMTSLKEYESMIDKFRVNNHENKNELMTIRNLIKTKDKNTTEYIDKLVDNKIKDNEKIMYKTAKIPEGGLRATIYSKLTLMDKYKIKYTLDIANDVRTVDLINLGENLVLDICKILGVFLDNAIDAVRELKKKKIDIEFYVMDSFLIIDITNNFKGRLELNKFGTKGYTTKGDSHGYGLSLVNQIISEDSNILINEKSINGDRFTQTLKIKM